MVLLWVEVLISILNRGRGKSKILVIYKQEEVGITGRDRQKCLGFQILPVLCELNYCRGLLLIMYAPKTKD